MFLIVLIRLSSVYAQCPTPSQFGTDWTDGSFSIAGIEVGTQCTGRAIRITSGANVTNPTYIYNYKDKADLGKATASTSFTYTEPGPYYIVQLGTVNGKPSLFCNLVQVYGASPPVFTLEKGCDATAKISINTTGQIYGRYLIDWGDGRPPQIFMPGQNPPTYTYANAGTYQIRVTGEGTFALVGCNATSAPQTYQNSPIPQSISIALTSVVDGQRPTVSITLPTNTTQVKGYVFTKNGMEITKPQNSWTDSTANATEQSYCYQVSYRDQCDKSPTDKPSVCTIHLRVQDDLLTWTSQSPFVQPVQTYSIEKLDANGQVLRTYNNIGSTTQWLMDADDPDQEVYYRVKATSAVGQISLSNVVKINKGVQLIVPDAFTPNQDQINDVLDIKGQFIKQAIVKIYDRWGNIVYYTEDWRKSWDGNSKDGKSLPNDVYSYYIEAIDIKNNAFTKRGAVYLMR